MFQRIQVILLQRHMYTYVCRGATHNDPVNLTCLGDYQWVNGWRKLSIYSPWSFSQSQKHVICRKKNQTVEIMLSQSSQSYKDKHCVFFLICIIWGRGRTENEVGALRGVVGETGRAGSREEKCDKPERWERLAGHFDCQLDWIKKKLGVK